MFPQTNAQMPLQSHLFGHRLNSNQTKYEYLNEFLLVALSPKSLQSSSTIGDYTDMFPLEKTIPTENLSYFPEVRMGLKRFIFFSKGKLDGKAPKDKEAYETLLSELKGKMNGYGNHEDQLFLLESLLNGYTSTQQTRSWFVQNMLPICPEAIFPESMGNKKLRVAGSKDGINLDRDFDFHQHTYFCRGGEIYYLHVLQAMLQYPVYKDPIEKQLEALLNAYPSFSQLSQFIQKTWEDHTITLHQPTRKPVKMDLTSIPDEFSPQENLPQEILTQLSQSQEKLSKRNLYTLMELKNLLESNCHPFEKMELLSTGLLLQMFSLMYQKAGDTKSNYWVIDVNSPDFNNKEMKKFAQNHFLKNEDMIKEHLYQGYPKFASVLNATSEEVAIRDAYKNTIDIFRKLGKVIGLMIPTTGPGTRFTLSEDLIKFLVLALVPPRSMMTLDKFLETLHEHFAMVIGPEEYKKEIGGTVQVAELPFLEENKRAFSQKMKDCGFLRDLSDATSIVENPYP